MNRFFNKNILIILFNKNKEMKRITTKASNTSNTDQQLFLSPPRNYELFQVFPSDHHFFQYPDHFFFCFKIDFLVNICCSGRIFRQTPLSPIQSLVFSLPILHFYPISFKVSKNVFEKVSDFLYKPACSQLPFPHRSSAPQCEPQILKIFCITDLFHVSNFQKML